MLVKSTDEKLFKNDHLEMIIDDRTFGFEMVSERDLEP